MAVAEIEELGFEKTLEQEVVGKGLCAGCGACVAFCPFGVIELRPKGPELVDTCLKCGNCYSICPRYELDIGAVEEFAFGRRRKPDEEFGVVRSISLARSRDDEVLKVCQDGGVVTTLLRYLIGQGLALSAVAVGVSSESPWLPEPKIAITGPEVLGFAGSRYTYAQNLMGHLGPAAFLGFLEGSKAAFVGLPCQVAAARKIQMLPIEELGWHKALGPIIGLFCTETFDYDGLMALVREKLGLELGDVVKMNIKKGRLYFYPREGEPKSVRVRELHDLVRDGCRVCTDFSAELADISVGSLGLEGWNVVILRSELGEQVFKSAIEAGLIETRPIEEEPGVMETLLKLTAMKKKRGGKAKKA